MNSPQRDEMGAESPDGTLPTGGTPFADAMTAQTTTSDLASTPIPPTSPVPNRSSSSVDPQAMPLWLRRTDQIFVGVLLIALIGLLFAFRWKLSNGFRNEIEITSQQPREFYYALDINQASWVEWSQLDGIGEKLAKRIVQDRQERGPFLSIEDVQRVKGIGPKMMEKLRPFLKIQSITNSESSELSQRPE